MSEVVKPSAVRYSVTFHQWLAGGSLAIRTLPAIWVHSCSVSRVACHWASGSAGHDGRDVVAAAGSPGGEFIGYSLPAPPCQRKWALANAAPGRLPGCDP